MKAYRGFESHLFRHPSLFLFCFLDCEDGYHNRLPNGTEATSYVRESLQSLRQEDDGTWTVFDIFTGLPARVNDVEQVGLEMEQADDLVDLLNLLYIKRRRGPVH
ncbi:hypothetical protein [Sinorhizobium meliloti]|uniref:hypothetical protein n=1 Tax=Rhizobium meliloti TaxID=382 RepID=UPI00132CB1AB|nr:hypothetical protein [Sinorhizobium meliloti]MQU69059.1 hypothetical protein [Sinorhizobium meliloti]